MGASFVEGQVRRLFEWYGPVVLKYRWPLFIFPIVVSLGLSAGFIRMAELRVDDPSYVFTPKDSRWRKELKVFSDNWPLEENKFLPGKSFETKRFVNILIRAKDKGSIMRSHVLREIQILNQWISNNITVPTKDRRYRLSYQDLCLSYDWVCGGNEHIEMMMQRHRVGQIVDLSYPRGGTKDTPVYLGSIIGDIEIYNENRTVKDANITQLFYFLKQEPTVISQYSVDFSYAVETFLLKYFNSDIISVSFAHYQSLQDGLDENAERFAPNFFVSFTTLAVYALICSFCIKRKPARGIDWIRSKPWLACAGLLITLMSLMSGFGLLMLLGVHYNIINTIIPFLIIAIGIDDMFIMNACWESSDRRKDVAHRLSQTLSHAGVAVSITNITDILSFGIGCLTDLPGIQLFCLYTCVSVAFCYIYQLTFFCGALALMGNAEHDKRHCLFFYKVVKQINIADFSADEKKCGYPSNMRQFQRTKSSKASIDLTDTSSVDSSEVSFSSQETAKVSTPPPIDIPPPMYQSVIAVNHHNNTKEKSSIVKFFGDTYGPFILTNPIRLLSLLLFVIYAAGAYYGCINFREGLNPGNLVTNDHYISKYFEDLKSFWKSGPQLHVAILDPPSFLTDANRKEILKVVSSFENTTYTMGREGTMFFLLEYLNYLNDLNVEIEDTTNLWQKKLKSWLKYTGGASQWASDIRMSDTDPNVFKAIRFEIAMKHIVEPNDHKLAAKTLREIADKASLQVQIYYEAFPFADQYLIILPATIQNVLISLFCMTLVSLLMVPSIPCGVVIFISIISINFGVFGYMTLWGVNLDAVSMISIIMSIGFAVDLSAHIIYAFVTSHGDTYQRVYGALETLGWPIFQGASSTIAGITILYTVDAYIILTFFKTIWLTMMIGAIHGLFFIPVFLSLFPVSFFRIPKSSELH